MNTMKKNVNFESPIFIPLSHLELSEEENSFTITKTRIDLRRVSSWHEWVFNVGGKKMVTTIIQIQGDPIPISALIEISDFDKLIEDKMKLRINT